MVRHEARDGDFQPLLTRARALVRSAIRALMAVTLLVAIGGLTAFAWIWYYRGLDGAAAGLACVALGSAWYALSSSVRTLPPRLQKHAHAWAISLNVAVLVCGVQSALRPVDSRWTQLPGTLGWSDTAITVAAHGELFALAGRGRLWRVSDPLSARHADMLYYGASALSLAYDAHSSVPSLWVLPDQPPSVSTLALDGQSRWTTSARPPGDVRGFAVANSRAYLCAGGWLYGFEPSGGWHQVAAVDGCTDVALDDGAPQRIFVLDDARWMQSDDGGVQWTRGTLGEVRAVAAGVAPGVDSARAGRRAVIAGGWRYVYDGGMLRGTLYVSAPGRDFRERTLPAPDVQSAVANPRDGAECWIATWGQGVFRTVDGGAHWTDEGLAHVAIRQIAVDFASRRLFAVADNLARPHGIFVRTY